MGFDLVLVCATLYHTLIEQRPEGMKLISRNTHR